MVRLSNGVLGVVNIITLLISIPILVLGGHLSHKSTTDCESFLVKPLIIIGVILLLVSLAGIVGSCCRVSLLLWIYLFVTFVLIVVLALFTVFSFVVTNKAAGEVVSGRGIKEYRLGNYSSWLRKKVTDEKNWGKIRSCLVESRVCERLVMKNDTVDQFFREKLSPLQSGCCKPPSECGFTYMTATTWNTTATSGEITLNNTDCNTWNNTNSVLCYDCKSCKAGILANIRSDWKTVAIVNIVVLIFLIVVYSIGCCAFRNNRIQHSRWKGRP